MQRSWRLLLRVLILAEDLRYAMFRNLSFTGFLWNYFWKLSVVNSKSKLPHYQYPLVSFLYDFNLQIEELDVTQIKSIVHLSGGIFFFQIAHFNGILWNFISVLQRFSLETPTKGLSFLEFEPKKGEPMLSVGLWVIQNFKKGYGCSFSHQTIVDIKKILSEQLHAGLQQSNSF